MCNQLIILAGFLQIPGKFSTNSQADCSAKSLLFSYGVQLSKTAQSFSVNM